MSLAQEVRKTFQRMPEGAVIASRELHKLSAENQGVDKAASRLYKTEGLEKLRNGLYYKPYNSRFFGRLPPREGDVIRAVRQQYNARVSPSGALAAYELGLVQSLPDAITYQTDKRISPIRLDNHTIYFNKVNGNKLLSVESSLLSILKAIEFLYEEESALTPLRQSHISRLLNRFSTRQVYAAVALWPRWFQEKFHSQFQLAVKPYITGLSALNIPYQGKQADWHQMGMLYSHKFQIAGKNYGSAPGLGEEELFDCGQFLSRFNVDVGTSLCATPTRAIKDILYTSIIRKSRYPGFFMLDQFMLDIPQHVIQAVITELESLANDKQKPMLKDWAHDNELD